MSATKKLIFEFSVEIFHLISALCMQSVIKIGRHVSEKSVPDTGGHLNAYIFENTVDFSNNAYIILAME